ncbi:MAG TPA: hypothetical protein VFI68_04150 [Anaerolineales bacterium]|nr:hypothetical protein [Anaerolineales bacterium]
MKKLIFSAFFAFALIAAQAGTVFAQDPMITGTVQTVVVETNTTTGESTVLVTYTDAAGATQTARLSVATAEGLGLVTTTTTTDPLTGETTTATTVNDGVEGTEVNIDPADVISDTETEEDQHPVGSKLAEIFSLTLGVDYDTIMSYRDDEGGTAGFGVIAQALWMTTKMDGDTALFQTIVEAKLSGDYPPITLDDGTIIESDNWGQFKKAILKGESENSVGDIMSGKNDSDEGETITNQNENSDQNGSSGNNDGNENGNKNKNKDKGNKGKGHK